MFYKNAYIYGTDFAFHHGTFEVVGDRFGAVFPTDLPDDAIDLQGAYVIPGLIDIHTHGALGFDFTADCDVEPGTFVEVRLTGTMDGELTGELA